MSEYSPQFDPELNCWTLRSYSDVRRALEDSRFAVSLAPVDEISHTALLRRAMDGFDMRLWKHCLLSIPFRTGATELVEEVAAPWSHAAALCLVRLKHDAGTLPLAIELFQAAARPWGPQPPGEYGTRLAAILPPALGVLTVQAFIAVSQTLAAFLGNAWIAALRMGAMPSVEELLRVAGPAQLQFRYLNSGVAGMPAGARVALCLAEANRESGSAAHLAFGHGAHACVGAMLIRTAASVIMPQFEEHYGAMKLDEVVLPEPPVAILKPVRVTVRRGSR